jgi:DNA-binding MarR family transcriptional regulator
VPNKKEKSLALDENIADLTSSWRRERPELDLSDFLLTVYILRMARIIDTEYDRVCRLQFGIRGSDMRILFSLRRAGKPYARRPTDLFKSLVLTSGAVTKQVDRLVKRRLVERLRDPEHRGGFLVRLTARGLTVADKAADVLTKRSIVAPAMKSLSRKDREQAHRFCRFLLTELDKVDVRRPH